MFQTTEFRFFWDLVKSNLSKKGLEEVAEQYPELREEAAKLAKKKAS